MDSPSFAFVLLYKQRETPAMRIILSTPRCGSRRKTSDTRAAKAALSYREIWLRMTEDLSEARTNCLASLHIMNRAEQMSSALK